MSTESKSEATWRAFFMAAISAGVGTVIGMIAGFMVGGLADTLILAATGHEQVRYSYLLAEAGTYVGLFVGIVAGIGAGATSAAAAKTVESSAERPELPPDGAGVRAAEGIERSRRGDRRDEAGDNPSHLGGAAAA